MYIFLCTYVYAHISMLVRICRNDIYTATHCSRATFMTFKKFQTLILGSKNQVIILSGNGMVETNLRVSRNAHKHMFINVNRHLYIDICTLTHIHRYMYAVICI